MATDNPYFLILRSCVVSSHIVQGWPARPLECYKSSGVWTLRTGHKRCHLWSPEFFALWETSHHALWTGFLQRNWSPHQQPAPNGQPCPWVTLEADLASSLPMTASETNKSLQAHDRLQNSHLSCSWILIYTPTVKDNKPLSLYFEVIYVATDN